MELTAGGKRLAEAKVQRGIFQGNALSLLLFIIAMVPLNHILRKCTAGYKLSRSQDKIRTPGKNETYKFLGILEADTIKQVEMIDKIQKEYLRRTRKLLEIKLLSRNLMKGINTWAVTLVRYWDPFSSGSEINLNKWTKEQEN